MGVLSQVQRGVDQAIKAAGDAMFAVLVAAAQELDAQPGEDYEPSWKFYAGRGFWEMVDSNDFPGTEIQGQDRTLVIVRCPYDVDTDDFVNVDESVYHVNRIKSTEVGNTRVLQKLLVRPETRSGIPWASSDLLAA